MSECQYENHAIITRDLRDNKSELVGPHQRCNNGDALTTTSSPINQPWKVVGDHANLPDTPKTVLANLPDL